MQCNTSKDLGSYHKPEAVNGSRVQYSMSAVKIITLKRTWLWTKLCQRPENVICAPLEEGKIKVFAGKQPLPISVRTREVRRVETQWDNEKLQTRLHIWDDRSATFKIQHLIQPWLGMILPYTVDQPASQWWIPNFNTAIQGMNQ